MSASSPFFFSPLSPPALFSPVWFLGSWESKKPFFGVVPAKMGKSSGATFSKIQVDIASNCCQMAKNDRILADERPLEHFLAILAHFMQYLPGFLKRWLLKICPFWPERHRKRVFWTPMSLETTRERKEKGGERGEKKKRTAGTHNFYIAYFGDSF